MSVDVGESCELPIAKTTIENNNCFLPCNDNTDKSDIYKPPYIFRDPTCTHGGYTEFQQPKDWYYIMPEVCSSGDNYGLMIPKINGRVYSSICVDIQDGGIIVNSENDKSLKSVEDARRAIIEFTRQIDELDLVLANLRNCKTEADTKGLKTLDNPSVRCNLAYEVHEESHRKREPKYIEDALERTKAELPAMSKPRSSFKGKSCEQIKSDFSNEQSKLIVDIKNNYDLERSKDFVDNEKAAHEAQRKLLNGLRQRIKNLFKL